MNRNLRANAHILRNFVIGQLCVKRGWQLTRPHTLLVERGNRVGRQGETSSATLQDFVAKEGARKKKQF